MEDSGVGDAEVEDGITCLPRYRGPHGDACTSALKKRRALGLRRHAGRWCSIGLEEVDGAGFK